MAEERTPDFAELLRRARRAANLSQEELAERAGLSVRAISALEQGANRAPRRATLDMLADALDLPADERRRWDRVRRRHATRPNPDAARSSPRATGPPPANLPVQPTRFFGRDDELATLAQMVRGQEAALVTLTGPGGSGKTRLALQIAAALIGAYADGGVFVDLAPVSDPQLALTTIATTLGLRPRPDQPLTTTLTEWLADKRMLLVLDNLEQILAVAPEIGELLRRCPELQILATSRAPLRLRAEREFPVPPLPLPPAGDAANSQALAEYDVVRLFIDRARAVQPRFSVSDEDAFVVAHICRKLDGLPLAVELAAASVRLFPPKAILARLEQRLPLVAGGHRDAPARQQTLRDTIAWSYDLLRPEDQALFRRLGLFKGGWTLDAAEEIASEEGAFDPSLRSGQAPSPGSGQAPSPGPAQGAASTGQAILAGSARLVEHSLIQSHAWLDGTPRFAMLETLREFGLEQLAARGETDAIHRRHAEYFLRLNHQAAEQLRGPRYRHWLQRGDAEVENVRLALAWAVAQDPELAIRLGREAGWYFLTRGAMLEARQWLERALAAAEQIPDDLRAGALVDIGMQATTCGDFAAAESVIQESLAVYRQLGDEVGEATCLFNLARVAGWQGNNTEAVSFATQALGPLRRADDSLLTMALANLGLNLRRTGALEQAAAILEEGLAQGERRGDIWACVVILKEQGWLELERGDLRRARQALRRAMLLNRDLADPRYLSQVLDVCAWLAVAEGAAERAARLLGAAMRLRAIIGVPFVVRYQRDYDHYVPAARAQIGDAAWEAAWAEGHALSQEDAIELALQGLA